MSKADVTLDFEIYVCSTLPASPHKLRGTQCPFGERVQVWCQGVRVVRRHLAPGQLLRGDHC